MDTRERVAASGYLVLLFWFTLPDVRLFEYGLASDERFGSTPYFWPDPDSSLYLPTLINANGDPIFPDLAKNSRRR